MNNWLKLGFSAACILVVCSCANAAGEIDSHRVWGEGLFGMHLPYSRNQGAQPADSSGVYRDQYGALRDSSMSSDTIGGSNAQRSGSAQQFSTSGLGSPANTFVGTEQSPNNQS